MTVDTIRQERVPAAGVMLELTDGSRHALLRKVVFAALAESAPPEIAIREAVEQARETIRSSRFGEALDLRPVLESIPLRVMRVILGVPPDLADWFARRAVASLVSSEPNAAIRVNPSVELLRYFASRARAPGRDETLVGALRRAKMGGHPLGVREIAFNCLNLALGGITSTLSTLCSAANLMVNRPALAEHLISGQGDVSTFGEEVLRWTSPAMHVARTATVDIEVGRQLIRAGDVVTLWLTSANRDERVFVDPDEFLADRSPNPHVAFATGAHSCVGAMLARRELTMALPMLAQELANAQPAGLTEFYSSNFVNVMKHLPVRVNG